MDYAAVIFDLDGTLADTLDGIAASMNQVLSRRGLPTHDREAYRRFIGDGVRKLVERALPDGQADRCDAVLDEYLPVLIEAGGAQAKPYPQSLALLDELAGRDVPLAVLSNKPDEATRDVVERLFGLSRFAAVRGQVEGEPIKPDPTAALVLAKVMGVAPADCAFVGDSDVDMRTARAAGMVAIGAGWGIRGPAELHAAGAAVVLDEPLDLLRA